MPHGLTRHNRPVWDHLHPLVYAVVAGTVLWFVLAAWIFFGGAEYMSLLLAVVSGFFLMAVAIPFALSRVGRKQHRGPASEDRISFRDWAPGEFETQPGRRKALGAAIEIIFPLAAAAAGMTAMGLIFHFTAVGSVHRGRGRARHAGGGHDADPVLRFVRAACLDRRAQARRG